AKRSDENLEHVDLSLGRARLDGEHVAGSIVQKSMNPYGDGSSVELESLRVANIGVPEGSGALGFPAKATVVQAAVPKRDPVEPARGIEPTNGRGRTGAFGQASVRDGCGQDRGHRNVRVLLANLE